jgi:hypothetical protein
MYESAGTNASYFGSSLLDATVTIAPSISPAELNADLPGPIPVRLVESGANGPSMRVPGHSVFRLHGEARGRLVLDEDV